MTHATPGQCLVAVLIALLTGCYLMVFGVVRLVAAALRLVVGQR